MRHVQAPPLVVTTNLTTESVQGRTQGGQGSRMDKEGYTKCVAMPMSLAELCAGSPVILSSLTEKHDLRAMMAPSAASFPTQCDLAAGLWALLSWSQPRTFCSTGS